MFDYIDKDIQLIVEPIFIPTKKKTLWKLSIFCKKNGNDFFFNILSYIIIWIYKNQKKEIDIIIINNLSKISDLELSLIKNLSNFYINHINIFKKINDKYKRNIFSGTMVKNYKNLDLYIFKIFLQFISNYIIHQKIKEEDIVKDIINLFEENKKLLIDFSNSSFLKLIKTKFGVIELDFSILKSIFSNISSSNIKKEFIFNDKKKNKIFEYKTQLELFNILIYESSNSFEKIYKPTANLPKQILNQLASLRELINNKIKISEFFLKKDLFSKIIFLESEIKKHLYLHLSQIPNIELDKISYYLTFDYLNLKVFFPLLIDDFIEEFFLDEINSFIYLNHQRFGRCITTLKVSTQEINSILTYLRLESNLPLDMNHPSLIYVMKNNLFHCRFSVDIFPYHWKNVSIDVRKLSRNILSLIDLIKFNTLNFEIASLLILCQFFRVNITIAGEVNSGKTTLLNALDLYTAPHLRKIYIEELEESITLNSSVHQLKYIVKPEYKDKEFQKSQSIYNLLHRSGEFIILGEIIDEEETKAFFHSLSVGLSGIQTTHASNIESLLNRWLIHFSIQPDCLNDLGIIIIMKNVNNSRFILSINEVSFDRMEEKVSINYILKFDPEKRNWKWLSSIENLLFFKKLNSFHSFSVEKWNKSMEIIKNFLYSNRKKFSNQSPDDSLIGLRDLYNLLKNEIYGGV